MLNIYIVWHMSKHSLCTQQKAIASAILEIFDPLDWRPLIMLSTAVMIQWHKDFIWLLVTIGKRQWNGRVRAQMILTIITAVQWISFMSILGNFNIVNNWRWMVVILMSFDRYTGTIRHRAFWQEERMVDYVHGKARRERRIEYRAYNGIKHRPDCTIACTYNGTNDGSIVS